jgi:hypothetical protein
MDSRVELNALASDERKLEEHGIHKVVPDDATIADAYRRAQRQAVAQAAIDKALKELGDGDKSAAVPDDLRERIDAALKENLALPWDAVLTDMARADHAADDGDSEGAA